MTTKKTKKTKPTIMKGTVTLKYCVECGGEPELQTLDDGTYYITCSCRDTSCKDLNKAVEAWNDMQVAKTVEVPVPLAATFYDFYLRLGSKDTVRCTNCGKTLLALRGDHSDVTSNCPCEVINGVMQPTGRLITRTCNACGALYTIQIAMDDTGVLNKLMIRVFNRSDRKE